MAAKLQMFTYLICFSESIYYSEQNQLIVIKMINTLFFFYKNTMLDYSY